jgi:hypothetical protein
MIAIDQIKADSPQLVEDALVSCGYVSRDSVKHTMEEISDSDLIKVLIDYPDALGIVVNGII